jgi:predicted transcriptional regulator
MGTTIKIADAELEIMRVLWTATRPMTSTGIRDKLRDTSEWGKSTVLTLIGRLVKKGAVSCKKEEHLLYTPLVSEKDYRNSRTRQLIDTLYNGSARNLVVALCTTGNLTQEERDELQQYLEGGLEKHE